jgi:transcriptional regulator with XRE-family HTH domain
MGSRQRAVDIGAARGRELVRGILTELVQARLDRGLSGSEIARAMGISAAQYSRIERGLTASLLIQDASALLAAVGLELGVRAHPRGEPLRDRAHAALLERLRVRVHSSLRFETEVPLRTPGDRRAWDAVVSGARWRHGIEAETRPRDLQALERRLALKLRDGDVSSMSLLLLDSRHNRDFIRAHGAALRERFAIDARRTLALLAGGLDPGGNSVLLL